MRASFCSALLFVLACNQPDVAGPLGSHAAALVDDAGLPPAFDDELPRCLHAPSELMVLGDSYVNLPLTHDFPGDLAREAGQRFRLAALPGYSMATGGLGLLPCLFEISIALDPNVHTVLMNGGGNDILLGDVPGQCKHETGPNVPICRARVRLAVSAIERLFVRMAAVGVRDVVYFFYPHVPRFTLLGGEDPNAIIDYALPRARSACNQAERRTGGKLRCHFVDLIPVFAGQPEREWFFVADIHPTALASRAMARVIWQEMRNRCIGQVEASGCCEP